MTSETAATGDKKPLNIFIGSQGLRAGWGILLLFAVTAATFFVITRGLAALNLHSPKDDGAGMDAMGTLFGEGVMAAIVLIATLITALIERRSPGQLGLSLKNALPRFVQGIVVGFVALAALIGALWLCHAIVIDKIVLHGAEALKSGALWAAAFLMVGLFEELMFRTYLQQTIARGLNFRISALVLSALFLAAHMGNGGENYIGLGMVFAAGIVLALSVWRSGTIWWAVGFHASWDWAQSFFFGVADSGQAAKGALMQTHATGPDWLSGGTVGPEGSVLGLAALGLTAIVIMLTIRKQDEKLDIRW